jgi:hypothetical protein
MYKTPRGTYVVLTAGATCFGVPQGANGDGRWGGTGIFAYTAKAAMGPYTYYGNVNSLAGLTDHECGDCMGNQCPGNRCSLPVQINTILRRFDGTPIALAGSTWSLNAFNQTTNILGNYAEYWQPWADVVDHDSGLPRTLQIQWTNVTLTW